MILYSSFCVLVTIVVVLFQCLFEIVVPVLWQRLFQIVMKIYIHLFLDAFDKFVINKVIGVFHRQRQERDQFSVLIFTEESNLSRMGKTKFQPCDPRAWCNTPLANNALIFLVVI